MRSELPAERLQRRLSGDPDADAVEADDCAPTEDASEDDQNSLLPRWLPDASQREGWLARVRADPGRAGAIAAAIVATLAVLVTVFTLLRDRPPPVMSAKLPPVERVSGTSGPSPKSSAAPGSAQPGGSDRPVVVSVVGLVHTPGLVTLAPGARIADALQAAGGAMDGADHLGVEVQRLGHARQLHLVGPYLVLGGCPVLAAPLDRPIGYREPMIVQDLVTRDQLFPANRRALAHQLAQLRRDLGGVDAAKFVAERGFLCCERQLHGSLSSIRV